MDDVGAGHATPERLIVPSSVWKTIENGERPARGLRARIHFGCTGYSPRNHQDANLTGVCLDR
jgi:hypothetical protein